MKNFLCVTRKKSIQITSMIDRIETVITSGGGRCDKFILDTKSVGQTMIEVPEDCECIIAVGGDGTLIWAASAMGDKSLPLVGVNCGHLGYLCDIDSDTVEEELKNLLNDDFSVEQRMMLDASLAGDNKLFTGVAKALNDVVISGEYAGRSVINLTVEVNGSYLYSYDCDGLLFATPTGSTAYNMSANGPIVNPSASCILMTPINAHALNSRSIVLDEDDRITVTLNNRRDDVEESAQVMCDGRCIGTLTEGAKLDIARSTKTTSMISLSDASFLVRMRSRMQSV